MKNEIGALGDLVEAGKVRAVGVSNFSAADMEKAQAVLAKRGIVLASNQVRISLLDRAIERNGLLEAARRLGVTLIAYSPLAQGVLDGASTTTPGSAASVTRARRIASSIGPRAIAKTAPLVAQLKKVAAVHGATASQVALNWTVSYWGDVVVAIPGASRPSQASEAALAMKLELTRAELDSVDAASRAIV